MDQNFQRDPRHWTDQEREAFAEEQYWRDRYQLEDMSNDRIIQNQQNNLQPNQQPCIDFNQYRRQMNMQNIRQQEGQYQRQVIENGSQLHQAPQVSSNQIQSNNIGQQQVRHYVQPQINAIMSDRQLQHDIKAQNSYLRNILQQQRQINQQDGQIIQANQRRERNIEPQGIQSQPEIIDIPNEFELEQSLPEPSNPSDLSFGRRAQPEHLQIRSLNQVQSQGIELNRQRKQIQINRRVLKGSSLQLIQNINVEDPMPCFNVNQGSSRQVQQNQSNNQNSNELNLISNNSALNLFGVQQQIIGNNEEIKSNSNHSTPIFKQVSGEDFNQRFQRQRIQPNEIEESRMQMNGIQDSGINSEILSQINRVKINEQINFYSLITVLKDKGKPVYHQLPPFRDIENDPRWEIPSSQDPILRQQSQELAIQKQIYEQKKILTVLDGIQSQSQMMAINQKKFTQEITNALNIEQQQKADRNYRNQNQQNNQMNQVVMTQNNQISEVGIQNELLKEIIRMNNNNQANQAVRIPQSQDANQIMSQQIIQQVRPQISPTQHQSNDLSMIEQNMVQRMPQNQSGQQENINIVDENRFESPRSRPVASSNSRSGTGNSRSDNSRSLQSNQIRLPPHLSSSRSGSHQLINEPEEERKQYQSSNPNNLTDNSSPNSGALNSGSNRMNIESRANMSFGGRSLIHNQSISIQSVYSGSNRQSDEQLPIGNAQQNINMPEMIQEEESKNERSHSINMHLQQQQPSICRSNGSSLFDQSKMSMSEGGNRLKSIQRIKEESVMSIDRDRKKISQMKKIKAILNPKYFSNISKQEPHKNQSHEFSLGQRNDLRELYFEQKSSAAGSHNIKFDQLIQNIKQVVQQGGNYCLQRFNSFGMSEDGKEEEKKQNELGEESNNAIDVNESSGEINYFAKMMDKDSELLSQFSKQKVSNKSISLCDSQSERRSTPQKSIEMNNQKPRSNSVVEKQLKDSQFNHSKLIRQIENLLQKLNIDFNEGIIIQMDLQEKLRLKQRIELALQTRDDHQRQISFEDNQQDSHKKQALKCNLSESDAYPYSAPNSVNKDKNRNSSGKIIQQMRHNYYMGKSSQKRKIFSQFQSSSAQQSKMLAHNVDYDFYFKNNQGMFVVKSQVKYIELNRMKRQVDFEVLMKSTNFFKQNKSDLYQELIYTEMLTICFDIENVLVRKVNIFDDEQLQHLKEALNHDEEQYVIVPQNIDQEQDEQINDNMAEFAKQRLSKNREKLRTIQINHEQVNQQKSQSSNGNLVLQENENKSCCRISKIGLVCACDVSIYQIRPYTYEILRAIQPFFEIVATSFLPYNHLDYIIEFIETVLNKPIFDMNEKLKNEKLKEQSSISPKGQKNKQKKRRIKKIEPKIYFQFLFSKTNYVYVQQADEYLENLLLLTTNRKIRNIFLLSSNQLRILAAMEQGFCAIPIIKFDSFLENDFQLNLVENYLVKLKYGGKNMKSKNQCDFGYLMNSTAIQRRHQNKLNENQTNESIFQKNASNYQSIQSNKNSISQQNSNLSFGDGLNGFHQLSLDIDCIIHEDQKGEHTDSSQNNKMSKNKSSGKSNQKSKNESLQSDRLRIGSSINSYKCNQNKLFQNQIAEAEESLESNENQIRSKGKQARPEEAKSKSKENLDKNLQIQPNKNKALRNVSVASLKLEDISENSS